MSRVEGLRWQSWPSAEGIQLLTALLHRDSGVARAAWQVFRTAWEPDDTEGDEFRLLPLLAERLSLLDPGEPFLARAQGVSCVLQGPALSWPEQVMQATEGRGVDLAFDQLGGDALIGALRSLAPMGQVVSINVVTGMPTEDVFKEMRALLARSPALRAFSMHTLDQEVTIRRGLMQAAIDQMASGQVEAPTAQVLALSQIQQAHAWLDAGASRGKLVIRME